MSGGVLSEGGYIHRGVMPREGFDQRVFCSDGGFVRRGLYPEGICPKGLCSRGLCPVNGQVCYPIIIYTECH